LGALPKEPRQRELAALAVLNDPARPGLLILDNLEDLSRAQAAQLAAFLRQINPQSGRSLARLPVGWLASLLDLAEAAALHPEMIRLGVGRVFGTRNWEDTIFVLRKLEPQKDVQEAVGRLGGKMVEDLLDPKQILVPRLARASSQN